ncbi:hypothetical protein [Radiobacillus deserti]|uniref:Uncharacterized protein n=1 Tax=Radiobacillus deserti TaxID=2594883 RepID=A0A516KII0_9BACI|nr:hypothetical protein [Radiobacillus deserti]QDP41156.1 hypothetical protein FN924_13740 [Radiobacillus deserti]
MKFTKDYLLRKLLTTIVTTSALSFLFVFLYAIKGFEFVPDLGNQLLAWFFVYFMYIGVVILLYGNVVSIIVDYAQYKWFPKSDWLYVLILGIFGLANGLFFQLQSFAIVGMAAAILYGLMDKWLSKRKEKEKKIRMFLFAPIALLVCCWGFLQLISPPEPPFTKEDAVEFATSSEGSVTALFPDQIGKWEGTIDGYQVIRKTDAKDIGKETYLVTFSESWKKGEEEGKRTFSYKVERGSLTMSGENGEVPPY